MPPATLPAGQSVRPMPPGATEIGGDEALWEQCLAIAALRRQAAARGEQTPQAAVDAALEGVAASARSDAQRAMVALYRPLLAAPPGRRYVSAHLGQSIDGRIATRDGSSRGLNGEENLVHLHRMRALSDAIIVGAGTVLADDPQLTTRLVPGSNPVRVVLDRRGRVAPTFGVCTDGCAPTLILTGPTNSGRRHVGDAEVVELPLDGDSLHPDAVLEYLASRGLDVVFIEGGGVTVSRFLEAGRLDRLQVTIAPVVFGAGVRGLTLESVACVDDAIRPPARQFALGCDRLWDFEFDQRSNHPARS